MADISRGPVPTMPGSRHTVPAGSMCDDHPDRPAVCRFQGETDSFGCEYFDLCAFCLEDMQKAAQEDRAGICDWCKGIVSDLRNHRDLDEGMCGPVYRVCCDCITRESDRLRQELDSYDDDW